MKDMIRQLAAYNYWANRQLTAVINQLPEEQTETVLASSFPGLKQTLLHIWNAESVWWQRLRLVEQPRFPGDGFTGTCNELISGLLLQSKQWEDWSNIVSEAGLGHVIQFYTRKQEPGKIQTSQLAVHVFNHSTYHRGQLVTMLHQLGHKKIPATDFIVWGKIKK